MSAIGILFETARRSWLKTIRRPVPLTFSFVQPLFWMLVFGFLFHRFVLGSEYSGLSYLEFLLPGICCMTVLFGASQSGVSVVRDLQTGFIQRMARSTARPGLIAGGILGAEVARLILQALVVAMVGLALGARLHVSIPATALAVLAIALFALAYGSLSLWIALRSRAPESMAAFVHVVNMPLLFTSTALVPTRQMPGWLGEIARYNPLSLVADALRQAILFNRATDFSTTILPVLGGAMVLVALATFSIGRTTRD